MGCKGCLCLSGHALENLEKEQAVQRLPATSQTPCALCGCNSRGPRHSSEAYLAAQRRLDVQLAILGDIYAVSKRKESIEPHDEIRVLMEELGHTPDHARGVDAGKKKSQVGKSPGNKLAQMPLRPPQPRLS